MIRLIRYIFILLASTSCISNHYEFERSKLVINNQQIEILTAFKIFDNYITKKYNYQKNVYRQIEIEFNRDAEFPFLLETIKKEIVPNKKLEEELELLKNENFEHYVDSTFQIITKALPGSDTKILFIPTNPEYREFFKKFGMGMQAVTVGQGKIIVSIDPTFDNWQQLIPYVLAHEYHHSVWISRNFVTSKLTPLEYLILEGKADSFARSLFPDVTIPWFNMLTKDEEKRVWKLLGPELNKRNSEMSDLVMRGTKEIPYASGYAIGFSIINAFKINNPQITEIELIDIPADQILLLSKYDE